MLLIPNLIYDLGDNGFCLFYVSSMIRILASYRLQTLQKP